MNALQGLCVLSAKLNEFALEFECLKFCDPITIISEINNFKKNGIIVIYLYKKFYNDLLYQNRSCPLSITLHLQVILKTLYESVICMDKALTKFRQDNDRDAYFKTIFNLQKCTKHANISIKLINNIDINVDMASLNDVEKFLCKLNVIYPLIPADVGLEKCFKILEFVRQLCGSCAVASPEIFIENKPCLKCYEELTITPNQGHSLSKRLHGKLCNHITIQKIICNLENNVNTIENDIKENLGMNINIKKCLHELKEVFNNKEIKDSSHITIAEKTLNQFDLFSKIPSAIYSLSDFTYWSKSSEKVIKEVFVDVEQLNSCHMLYNQLKKELAFKSHGEEVKDIFSINNNCLSNIQRLFTGSVFISPGKVIDLLTNESVKNLENNPTFSKLNSENELKRKIETLISELQTEQKDEAVDRLETDETIMKTHNISEEINLRKRSYFYKVANMGYNKIMTCIHEQELLINKLVNVNMIGSIIYEILSKMMFGFIQRMSYMGNEIINLSDKYRYDEHLYMRNNLITKKIPNEFYPELSQKMYKLINGLIFDHYNDSYPLPFNVCCAYACDNADMLPHTKDQLATCIEGTPSTEMWMKCSYMEFFSFSDATDINDAQKKMWSFIRELVLAVALYNDTFGKHLDVCRIDDNVQKDKTIVITYNMQEPLYLKADSKYYISKDIYHILYHDLHSIDQKEISVEQKAIIRNPKYYNLSDLKRVDYDGTLVPECFISK
ncbi:DNA packaging terminase subunit 2/ transport protein [Murid herpesvirus 3]|uniref:DNA packaging terminase subunit 2/ transport protein n=2 Tax=Murid betaherpesvirus 3 TaxID=2560603 RepID=A0A1P8VIT9_9BETA|nr:DNA packaging terminase subunit 2/ transport protein [Murine roseolovirus]APZ76269.1 DNA packaging terminase subunit 2/ transport protein [Murid betaherpesvirus 3]AYH64720.1 DNA packaging terminase subunit 2/ transport protein [Murid herpesvirus 3]